MQHQHCMYLTQTMHTAECCPITTGLPPIHADKQEHGNRGGGNYYPLKSMDMFEILIQKYRNQKSKVHCHVLFSRDVYYALFRNDRCTSLFH